MKKSKDKPQPKPEISDPERIWQKICVSFRCAEDTLVAVPLAIHLSRFFDKLYFARYTHAPEGHTIAFTVKNPEPAVEFAIRQTVMNFFRGRTYRRPTKIKTHMVEGSEPHALAWAVVAAILAKEGTDKICPVIADVCHWMWNMAGFNYLQEAAVHGHSLNVCLSNLLAANKMSNEPAKV